MYQTSTNNHFIAIHYHYNRAHNWPLNELESEESQKFLKNRVFFKLNKVEGVPLGCNKGGSAGKRPEVS